MTHARKKILFITSRADLGGGPEHLYQLLKHAPSNVETFVACPNERPYFDRFVNEVGLENVISIPHRQFSLETFKRLINFINKHKIDVVHSHGKGAGIYARPLKLFSYAKKCVHTFHGLHLGDYNKLQRRVYLCIERILGCFTDKAICVSMGEYDKIVSTKFIQKSKLEVISNGVEVSEDPPAAKDSNSLNILAVNRYDYQKNPDLLIDIAKELAEKTDFNMKVIGTGDGIDEIRDKVISLGLDKKVVLVGGVTNPREYMKQSTVFISTSRWEGMPLALLEAMSEGNCVVASRVVGNIDVVIDGKTGILFETAEEACQKIVQLTSTQILQYSNAGHRHVLTQHSVRKMASKTFQLLAQSNMAKPATK